MAELLTARDRRTCLCAELTEASIGREVCVMGWAQRRRHLGSLIFIDLRDRSGIVQLAFDDQTDRGVFEKAASVRSEYVLCAHGTVRPRGEGAVNADLPTGRIEVAASELKILSVSETPPFEIVPNSRVNAELRLRHRYLDLRRPDMTARILARSRVTKLARDYYAENGFADIETPCLIAPTPEGARDYLVPSRLHHGRFYALPQSPQLYKQLLMVAGFDRYFQIARCFRDEDLRADRQPEFTQIDTEMSFVTEDDVMRVHEGFLKRLLREFRGIDLQGDFLRLTYAEAMERFGSDKPDMRFGAELTDLSDLLGRCGFRPFAEAVAGGGSARGICLDGGASLSRREIDALAAFAGTYGARGLAWLRWTDGGATSSYERFLTEAERDAVRARLGARPGCLVLIVADRSKQVVFDSLGALRVRLGRQLGLCDPEDFRFLWVTEFPLLEWSAEEGRYRAVHHPFTMPMDEDLPYLQTDPGRVRSKAYDIVLNGNELGGGSIRIHSAEIQSEIFRILGLGPEEAANRFGFLLEAFRYGVPPHGGLAFGLDRLTALLLGLEDIRDVIAFPKVQNASEPMSGSPKAADDAALGELGIAVTDRKDADGAP